MLSEDKTNRKQDGTAPAAVPELSAAETEEEAEAAAAPSAETEEAENEAAPSAEAEEEAENEAAPSAEAKEEAEAAAETVPGRTFTLNPVQCLEAVLFAAGDPVPLLRLTELLGLEEEECLRLLALLGESYKGSQHGIELRKVGDSYALASKPEANDVLEAFFAKPPKTINLSQAAYETLAVVAYNEPVTRAQLDSVRGVNSDGALNRLIEKGLVEQSGTLDLPGRPSVFKTTDLFLRLYGISSLEELEPMDMLMYDTVQAFEQSYKLTRELADKGESEDQVFASAEEGLDLGTVDGSSVAFAESLAAETADETDGEA